MRIDVERINCDGDTTISTVWVEHKFVCFGLEDEYRETKVKHETRIPAGIYQIKVRRHGGFHERYKKRFSGLHKGMLEVCDVENFTNVLIHCGNTDEHTSGCLLLGLTCCSESNKMSVGNSSDAYKLFYNKVIQAAIDGELSINFYDYDV